MLRCTAWAEEYPHPNKVVERERTLWCEVAGTARKEEAAQQRELVGSVEFGSDREAGCTEPKAPMRGDMKQARPERMLDVAIQ